MCESMCRISDTVERKFIDTIDIVDWEIETDTGWEDISHIHKTIEYDEWELILDDGSRLLCADNHIVFDENYNEIFVKDLYSGAKIITRDGPISVDLVSSIGSRSNMYDISVNSDNHRYYTNGILSHNSTFMCALTYGLFGKPFRNINKPQLVNSINQKNMLVEVEFEVGGKSYLIKRGMKPNIFQIFCDGTLINEESDTRDYQKILEQQILKLNFKTFTQVVILGSATFVPFMQLPAQKRREIIEDILDIRVFSVMNQILKEKMSTLKDQITESDTIFSNIKVKIESQKRFISALQSSNEMMTNSIITKIAENDVVIRKANEDIQSFMRNNDELSKEKEKYSNIVSAITQAESMKVKLNTILSAQKQHKEIFNNNEK